MTSARVNALSAPAEVFYRRLMSVVDDYGLYDGRPAILRANLYPLQLDRVREADVQRWIAECVKSGLVRLYGVEGKPYVQMLDTRWKTRSSPKFPLPTVDGCKQLLTVVSLDGDGCAVGGAPPNPPSGGEGGGVDTGGEDPPGFVRWWKAYPGKRAERQRCLLIWLGRKPTADGQKRRLEPMADVIIEAAKTQAARGHFRGNDGRDYIPNASTWLYNARWEDEVDGRPCPTFETPDEEGDALFAAAEEGDDAA